MTAAILRTCELKDDSLRQALEDIDGLRVAADVSMSRKSETKIRQVRPDVLIVIMGDSTSDSNMARVTQLAGKLSDTCILFAGVQLNPDQLLAGMRAGVREFVTLPTTAEDLLQVLENLMQTVPTRQRGKLIAFQGTGGGCGTSMIACNTAIEMVRSGNGSVCLVDLDINTGQLAIMLDLFPKHSLLDICTGDDDIDSNKLNAALLKHDSGLKLLARPLEWCEADLPAMGRSVEVIHRLLEMFDHVLIDMDMYSDITEGSLLSRVDEMILVTQPVTTSIRNAAALIRKFDEAGFDAQRLRLVLNRVPKRPGSIRQDRVEKSLKLSVVCEVPEDYESVSESLNLGIPLADHNTYSKARTAIRDLAGSIASCASTDDDTKKGNFIKRMFGTPSGA